MNILIVNRALATLYGGGESFDYNVALGLQKLGNNVVILTASNSKSLNETNIDGVKIIYLKCPYLRKYAYFLEKINTKLSAFFYHLDNLIFEIRVFSWINKLKINERYDIIQFCSLFWVAEKLILKNKQPVVSWLPGPPSKIVTRKIKSLVKKKEFGLHTHGSTKNKLIESGFLNDIDFTIINPGVDLSFVSNIKFESIAIRKRLSLDESDLVGITTARLVPIKNHLYLFNAISAARKNGVTWHWIIVGDGPLKEHLEFNAGKLEISDLIHFVGYCDKNLVHEYLACADLFALTSSYENLSIAVLEAMAHSLPIIGTNVGGLGELVISSKAGLTVPPDNLEILINSLILMKDELTRKSFGTAAKTFCQDYDWLEISKKLDIYFKSIINKSRL